MCSVEDSNPHTPDLSFIVSFIVMPSPKSTEQMLRATQPRCQPRVPRLQAAHIVSPLVQANLHRFSVTSHACNKDEQHFLAKSLVPKSVPLPALTYLLQICITVLTKVHNPRSAKVIARYRSLPELDAGRRCDHAKRAHEAPSRCEGHAQVADRNSCHGAAG